MGSRGNGSQNLNSIEILVESWKLMQKLKKQFPKKYILVISPSSLLILVHQYPILKQR